VRHDTLQRMALEPSCLSDYAIAGPLGSGATARVFEATHIRTGRVVAIKVLEPSSRDSHELQMRLEREARALAGVRSPHVGRIFGVGWEAGQPFLVLERLNGETLADVIKRERTIASRSLADWIEQLLLGVRDIHAANVIHRDIKPANIFLVAGGDSEIAVRGERTEQVLVKLIDFGVARLKEIALDGASLTSTHHLIGSMGYMAPEQLEYAKGVGPQADLYAVGIVVFRCLTGRLPHMGRSFEALHRMKVDKDPPTLSETLAMPLSASLEEFVAKALARKPEERFASAKEMLEAWWRVASALDRDFPQAPDLPVDEYDIEFEDSSTIVEHAVTNMSLRGAHTTLEVEDTSIMNEASATQDGYEPLQPSYDSLGSATYRNVENHLDAGREAKAEPREPSG
jgi:eukaryotic-like serine/threonine-protein kinase